MKIVMTINNDIKKCVYKIGSDINAINHVLYRSNLEIQLMALFHSYY